MPRIDRSGEACATFPAALPTTGTALDDMPEEVVRLLMGDLSAADVAQLALTCGLLAAWARLHDVLNFDSFDRSCSLHVSGSRLCDRFERGPPVASLVLAWPRQPPDGGLWVHGCWHAFLLGPRGDAPAAWHLRYRTPRSQVVFGRPSIQGVGSHSYPTGLSRLQLLSLENPPSTCSRWVDGSSKAELFVHHLMIALHDLQLPSLRSLTLTRCGSLSLPLLLQLLGRCCPSLRYLECRDSMETSAGAEGRLRDAIAASWRRRQSDPTSALVNAFRAHCAEARCSITGPLAAEAPLDDTEEAGTLRIRACTLKMSACACTGAARRIGGGLLAAGAAAQPPAPRSLAGVAAL